MLFKTFISKIFRWFDAGKGLLWRKEEGRKVVMDRMLNLGIMTYEILSWAINCKAMNPRVTFCPFER